MDDVNMRPPRSFWQVKWWCGCWQRS